MRYWHTDILWTAGSSDQEEQYLSHFHSSSQVSQSPSFFHLFFKQSSPCLPSPDALPWVEKSDYRPLQFRMETWLTAKPIPYPTYSSWFRLYKIVSKPQNKFCYIHIKPLEEQFWEGRTKSSEKSSLNYQHLLCARHHSECFTYTKASKQLCNRNTIVPVLQRKNCVHSNYTWPKSLFIGDTAEIHKQIGHICLKIPFSSASYVLF